MKRGVFLLLCLVLSVGLSAQEKMYIHKSDGITLGALISETDSVYFSNDGGTIYFRIGETVTQYLVSQIDSISFGDNSSTILVAYNGTSASVVNPLAFEGVSVTVNGADVTITSLIEDQEISYNLSGTTSDGMFKIYSNFRFNLILSGVSITNADGPAINIQTGKKCTIKLSPGTSSSLTDGAAYSSSTEDQKATFFSEGQLDFEGSGSLTVKSNSKHGICSDDYIHIQDGTITISGAVNDGIHCNDHFKMEGGTVNITATGDGIECEEGYIEISAGTITTINSAANVQGISCDSILAISGGNINMTISGNKSKGIQSGQLMILSGGTITINTSGGMVLETSGSGYDPSYCVGIKGRGDVVLSGSNITITSIGIAGKGISSDSNLTITGGTIKVTTSGAGATYKNSSGITDAYFATCISVNGNISIFGGSVTTSSSGTGGRGITSDGTLTIGDNTNSPAVNVTTTGGRITISSGNYAEAKAVKSDGAITIINGTIILSSSDDALKSETSITISNATVSITNSKEAIESPYITVNSGTVRIVATNDGFNATKGNGGESNDGSCLYLNGGYVVANVSAGDGLDSNGNIVMTGGTVIVHGPQSQPEVGMDVNGTCNISGGLLVISGTNSNMTEGPGSSSSQYSIIAKSSVSLSSSTLFHVQNASGNNIVTFQPVRSYYSMIFSSSGLTSGSTYYIYTGGSSTGTNTDGLYTGGTYSGGTLKKSFTISGKVTNVTF